MRIVRRLFLLVLCLGLTGYVYTTFQPYSVFRLDDRKYLLQTFGTCSYGFDTDNTVYTNLSGLSNGILRLQEEGYKIYSCNSDDNSIDIIIQNSDEGIVYRYYYTYNNRLLTCFCNSYENSYKALTYIIE